MSSTSASSQAIGNHPTRSVRDSIDKVLRKYANAKTQQQYWELMILTREKCEQILKGVNTVKGDESLSGTQSEAVETVAREAVKETVANENVEKIVVNERVKKPVAQEEIKGVVLGRINIA